MENCVQHSEEEAVAFFINEDEQDDPASPDKRQAVDVLCETVGSLVLPTWGSRRRKGAQRQGGIYGLIHRSLVMEIQSSKDLVAAVRRRRKAVDPAFDLLWIVPVADEELRGQLRTALIAHYRPLGNIRNPVDARIQDGGFARQAKPERIKTIRELAGRRVDLSLQ